MFTIMRIWRSRCWIECFSVVPMHTRRLVSDGLDNALAQLFSEISMLESDQLDRARSAIEAFLFCRLETLPETKGRF